MNNHSKVSNILGVPVRELKFGSIWQDVPDVGLCLPFSVNLAGAFTFTGRIIKATSPHAYVNGLTEIYVYWDNGADKVFRDDFCFLVASWIVRQARYLKDFQGQDVSLTLALPSRMQRIKDRGMV
jgi:hypothetical protein